MRFKFNRDAMIEKAQKIREKAEGGTRDLRFINYWDLKPGQELKIRFLPDAGEHELSNGLYIQFKHHRIAGEWVLCPKSYGKYEKCAICQRGWDMYHNGDREHYKEWVSKQARYAQCIVIDDGGLDIPEDPDGRIVRLLNMPQAVEEEIMKHLMNGNIEDPTDHTFVIVRTMDDGRASYSKSYVMMKPDPLPDEVLELIEQNGGLYDLSELIPAIASPEDEQRLIDAKREKDSHRPDTSDSDDDILERMKKR